MPLEGSKGEDKETMASSKEAAPKGGTDDSSTKGKKRSASDDPETMASKRGKILVRGSDAGEFLGRTTPSKGSALHRAVSRERFSF